MTLNFRGHDADEDEIDALRWALELPVGFPLLAVGSDGTPAPVPALDPRAFAIISAIEDRYLTTDYRVRYRLLARTSACARIAARITPEPFEPRHLRCFIEIADAIDEGGGHVDDRTMMRP